MNRRRIVELMRRPGSRWSPGGSAATPVDYLMEYSTNPLVVDNDIADAETIAVAGIDERYFYDAWHMRLVPDFDSADTTSRYVHALSADNYLVWISTTWRQRVDASNRVVSGSSFSALDDVYFVRDPWVAGQISVVTPISTYTGTLIGLSTVSDLVFGTPSGQDVTVTSAGANLPVVSASEWIAIKGGADPTNDGLYQVSGTPTTSAVDLTKRTGSPIAASATSTPFHTAPIAPGDVRVGMSHLGGGSLPFDGDVYQPIAGLYP